MDLSEFEYYCTKCGKPTRNITADRRQICKSCADLEKTQARTGNTKPHVYNYVCMECGEPTNHLMKDGRSICKNCEAKYAQEQHLKIQNTKGEYACERCGMPTDEHHIDGRAMCEQCQLILDAEQEKEEEGTANENTVDHQFYEDEEERQGEPDDEDSEDEDLPICVNCEKSFHRPLLISGISAAVGDPAMCSTCNAASDEEKKEIKGKAEENRKNNVSAENDGSFENKREKDSNALPLMAGGIGVPEAEVKDKPSSVGATKPSGKDKSGVPGKKTTVSKAATLKNIKNKAAQIKELAKNPANAGKALLEGVKQALLKKILIVAWPYLLGGLAILLIVYGIGAAFMLLGGIAERGAADAGNPTLAWNNPLFTIGDKNQLPGYTTYQGTNFWEGAAGDAGGANYLAAVPKTTTDLRHTSTSQSIANVQIPPNPTKASPAPKEYVLGTASVEIHLATNRTNPFPPHDVTTSLPAHYRPDVYMSASRGGKAIVGNISMLGQSGVKWAAGAFGKLKPENEKWYMNMRWNYTTKSKAGYLGKKVLIIDKTTGLMAVGYIGEYGPGAGLPKNSSKIAAGNRIAGLSPELMFYLGGSKMTGADAHEYSFGLLEDQSIGLGPVVIGINRGAGADPGDAFCGTYVRPAVGSNRTYNYRGPEKQGTQRSFYKSLAALLKAAKQAGFTVTMGGGFRTSAQQQERINAVGLVSQGGAAAALGTSCHEYGIAVDLVWSTGGSRSSASKAGVQWIHANAPRYGLRTLENWPIKECWHIQPLKKLNGHNKNILYNGKVIGPPCL